MEWSKTTISKADFEKKQREYMEAAINMAKKAEKKPDEETEVQPLSKEEIVDKTVEKTDDLTDMLDEIKENAGQTTEKEAEITETDNTADDCPEEKNIQFGVFDAEELVNAIESGEVSGEGLKQAAEILEEMTRKTETMRKLVEEQENDTEPSDGEDYGLNSFIDRHNSNCRGCSNEHGFKAT
ncbi:MAG: hypothetical protein IKK53_00425 [Ruminiclostridium sp.]|nr:hypothetical protein [Ruminiclostridium sp.]